MAVWSWKASEPKARPGHCCIVPCRQKQATNTSRVLWTELSPFHGSAEGEYNGPAKGAHMTHTHDSLLSLTGNPCVVRVKDFGSTENTRRGDHT